jgi:UDP-N-acetylmuramoyl-tripeptide--D-alanyl-D-alanine ligase
VAQALDFLAALAAVEALTGKRMLRDAIEAALAGRRFEGRMDLASLAGGVLLVDDTYNANPDSMRAALSALAELGRGRRKVAVLGEMKELGEVSLAEHEILGDLVAEAGVEVLVGCGGDLVGALLDRARARSVEVIAAASSDEAGRAVVARIQAGDVVLVKGSRGARTEVAAQAIRASRPSAEAVR